MGTRGDAGGEEEAEMEIREGGSKGEVLEVKLRCFL